jgi:hypothetical protein
MPPFLAPVPTSTTLDRDDRTYLFGARMKPVSQSNGSDRKLRLVITSDDEQRGKIGVNPTLSRNCNVFEMSKLRIQMVLDLELTKSEHPLAIVNYVHLRGSR